jgi:hypothetical protein
MAIYQVVHRYTARRDGETFGPWEAGDAIDLADADAEWVNRDSPGALEPVKPKAPVPAKDRQHRGGSTRGA